MGDTIDFIFNRASDAYFAMAGHGANVVDDGVALATTAAARSVNVLDRAGRGIRDRVRNIRGLASTVRATGEADQTRSTEPRPTPN